MDQNAIGVEEKETIAPGSQEVEKGVENASTTQEEGVVDYKAELEAQLKKVSLERDNYKKGLLIAKGKVEDDNYEMDKTVDTAAIESRIDALVEAKIEERLSTIKTSLTKNVVSNTLSELSNNEDERALIKYHYENSIIKSGLDPDAIRSDMENAKMIANKKSYFRTTKEMATALQNKSQVSGAGVGASADKNIIEPQFLSAEIIAKLKERGFSNAASDPKKVAEIMKLMKGKL
jgi:hypothetical protein